MIEAHLGQLDQQMADLLAEHHEAVRRLAEVPGLGVDSAQQIIAEVGATAATLTLTHADEEIRLVRGDAVLIRASTPRRWQNSTRRSAQVLIVSARGR